MIMFETERLCALAGQIYDAALDPLLWAEALPQVAHFVGGPSAALWSEDAASKRATVVQVSGLDVEYVDAYLSRYVDFDPTPSAFHLARHGEPFVRSRTVPDHDFFQTPYYRDWVRPQGLVDCMYVVLDRSGPQLTLFAVSRHKDDGAVDDRMFRRMRMIAPHLGRAIRIGQTIGLERRAAANLADALDGLSSAMFLVDAVGHVVHANAAGHSLLSKDDVLSVAGGRLRARDAESSSLLKDAFSAAGAGDAVAHTDGSSLPLVARDGDDYVARVLPLSARARRQAGKESGAVAAVFVCRAAPPEPAPSELIARRYRLTPMELRVLTAIVDIRGVANVADALGISSETVKTHLAHVYEKTGVNRQADLVKLVLRLSIPRIG